MKTKNTTLVVLVFMAILLIFSCFAQETITITTYYPSPFGVYSNLMSQRLAIGDINNNGSLDSADLPAADGELLVRNSITIGTGVTNDGRPLYVSRDASVSLHTAYFADSTGIGVSIGSKDGVPGVQGWDKATNTERDLSIQLAGNLGVGTDTLSEKLEVAGNVKANLVNVEANSGIAFRDAAGNILWIIFVSGGQLIAREVGTGTDHVLAP